MLCWRRRTWVLPVPRSQRPTDNVIDLTAAIAAAGLIKCLPLGLYWI